MLNKTPPDIPSGVIVGVEFLPTLQALELVTITVVLVREPTLRVTAPLRRVGRCNIVHLDAVFFSFVFDVALEFTERPLLELRGVRDAFADVFQVLDRNRRTIVLNGFTNDGLRDTV